MISFEDAAKKYSTPSKSAIPEKSKGFNLFDFTKDRLKDTGNLIGGAVEGVASEIGNISDLGNKMLKGAYNATVGNLTGLKETGETSYGKDIGGFASKKLQKVGYNPESLSAKTGKILAPIATTALTPELSGFKLAENAGRLAKTGKFLLGATENAAKWTGLTEGRLPTAGEVAGFGALDMATRGLTKALPKKLITGGEYGKDIIKQVGDKWRTYTGGEFNPEIASKWLLDNKITGSLVKQGEKLGETFNKYVDASKQLLSSVPKVKIENKVVTDLQKALREKLPTFAEKTAEGFKPTAGNEKIASSMAKLINSKGLTPQEINDARIMLGKNLFDGKGKFKGVENIEGWQNIWKNSSKFLDENIPGFREINKNIEIASTIRKAQEATQAKEAAQSIIQSFLKKSAGVGGGGVTGGGLGYLLGGTEGAKKGGAIGAALPLGLKVLVDNPIVRTGVASFLNQLTKEGRAGIKGANILKNSKDVSGKLSDYFYGLMKAQRNGENISNIKPLTK